MSKADALVLQDYGFCSAIPVDSELAVVFIGGHNEAGIVVASDSTVYRDTSLEDGEVKIYSKFGQSIKLGADGSVLISGKSIKIESTEKIDMESPIINISGMSIKIAGTGITDIVSPAINFSRS